MGSPGKSPQLINSAIELGSSIVQEIKSTTSFHDLVLTDIAPDLAHAVLDYIDASLEGHPVRKSYNSLTRKVNIRIMSTEVHDCHQKWWVDHLIDWVAYGQLTRDEARYLGSGVGTTLNFFYGPYAGSRKEPDFFVRPDHIYLPSFVIETGWSESWDRMMDDMNLWLVGGNGDVGRVLLLKWQKIGASNKVRGFAEMYGLDRNGIPVSLQREEVFPIPPQNAATSFRLPRKLLLGAACQNPTGTLELEMEELREKANNALDFMGLLPA